MNSTARAASRLPLLEVDEAPPLARRYFGPHGEASPLTRSLATAPDLLETLMPFLAQVMGEGGVDLATKELVVVRVSRLNGCRYCIAAHEPLARSAGVAPEQLEAAADRQPLAGLPAREQALLEWVDALVHDARTVDDDLTARLLEHFREDQLVELTLLTGAITMLNQYCTAFALPAAADG